VLVPGVRLHFGYPSLELGTRNFGWNTTFNKSTGQLDHALKVSAGTETTLLRYPSTATATDPFDFTSDVQSRNNLILKGGTGFTTTITSTPTANRIGTIQNSTGTFAWTSDIPSGAGLWTLATDVVKTTTNTHHVAFNDNVLNPGVTDTNTGFKINSDVYSVETGGTQAFTADSAQTLNVTNQISWKDNTSFKGILTHANTSSDKTYTFPDNSGTVALATGLSGGQTIYGGTGAGEDLLLKSTSNASDGDVVIGDGTTLTVYSSGVYNGSVATNGYFTLESGTGNIGSLYHSISANRSWLLPDGTGQVKLKKDKIAFFPSNQSTTFSKHSVDALTTSGGFGYIEFLCPNDFLSITSLVAVVIAGATDASVDIDLESEYGASTQDHATHTGSSTGTTYSLTEGRLTEISLTGVFASLATGDYCGIEVQNNDNATTVYLVGVRMVYTPTN